jgi:hypothetical protein
MNSPAGLSLFYNPLDMISTALDFGEWQYGEVDASNQMLTTMGQIRGMIPFVWNPAVELALWGVGAFGNTGYASMPQNMLGLDRLTKMGADILNLALYNGMLPEGMGRDQFGNPRPFSPRPTTDIAARIASFFGIEVGNPGGSSQTSLEGALYDVLLEQNPALINDPQQLLALVNEMHEKARTGEAPEEYIEAQRREFMRGVAGPDLPGVPEPLREIFGAVARFVSPVRISSQNTTKLLITNPDVANIVGGESLVKQVIDAGGSEYDGKDIKSGIFDTPAARALEVAANEYYQGGNPELAEAVSVWRNIVSDAPEDVVLGSVTFTSEDILALSERARYDLADEWIESQGWDDAAVDAFNTKQQEILSLNPDLAGYNEYKRYVEDEYPGGVREFVDEAMLTSPSFAQFMNGLTYPKGSPDWYQSAVYADAYLAINGQRGSHYDPLTMPERGTIPGMAYGTNFSVKAQAEQEIRAMEQNGFDEYEGDIQKDIDLIYNAQTWLDQNYPGVKAGAWLDKDVYAAMKAAGVAAPKPEDASVAYEYLEWLPANATGPDTSLRNFLEERSSGSDETRGFEKATDVTDDMLAEQAGYELVHTDPTARNTSSNGTGIKATPKEPLGLRSGPSTGNPIINGFVYDASMPSATVIHQQDGWAQISVLGVTGWVPEAYLQAVP